jgi:DNA-binding transcriptional LysR family regulator
MKLSLDALLVLDAVDRRGSFAAAAEELHRVPSAVSYAVQKLEEDLDLLVFDRRGHKAKLTTAGRALLDEGRKLLEHAQRIEDRVKKLATGWERELVIAVDSLIGAAHLLPTLCDFYALGVPTRIRMTEEVLGGTWDALSSRRADLAVGANGEPPASAVFASQTLGRVEFVFAVAPHHPLATAAEPLAPDALAGYRRVALADTSRNLPPRTLGLELGDDVLTMPTAQAKLAAQIAGVGIGHLPRRFAAPHLNAGTLVEKRLAEPGPSVELSLAWRSRDRGPALEWWLERLAALEYPGLVATTKSATGRKT